MQSKADNIISLRVFVSSTDKFENTPLYEMIVHHAKKQGLAGATVTKGILSYGGSSVLHSYKFWEVAEKVPTIVEIIDEEEKVMSFYEMVRPFLESMRYGCLVTWEKVNVLLYKVGDKKISDL
jgi:PII-like signaling protein